MEDFEKFERFEDLKQSEKRNKNISLNNENDVEKFIQLLVKNSRGQNNISQFK